MSRHRNIREIDVDEEYDGFYSCYGHSVEDDFCVSPNTESQFMYNRGGQRQRSDSFFDSPETVPEEENLSGEENLPDQDSLISLSELDRAKLHSCVEAMQDVVGDTISEFILQRAAFAHKFNLEKALQAVLQDKAPKPRRTTARAQIPQASSNKTQSTNSTSSVTVDSPKLTNKSVKTKDTKLNTEASTDARKPPISTSKEKTNAMLNERTESTLRPKPETAKSEKIPSQKEEPSTPLPSKSSAKPADNSNVPEDLKTNTSKSSKSEKNALKIYADERGSEKPLINLVVIGHVDAGKSTLMGHLLYRLGSVSQKNMHKFERDSKKLGKGSFAYAWVLDETPEERNRGITMDVAFASFETEHRSVVLLDAPGHRDFIPNMITGAAQADVAILVVDSTRGEFETGFEAGGQTREHTMLIRSLGVTEISVAVNKMDNIGWSEERFREIELKLSSFLKQVGFKESDVTFIPCSGLSGENLVSAPQEEVFKKWYTGPTLVQAIDNFSPPQRPVDLPLRLCISDAFKGPMGGFCVAGKIDSGFVKNGDKVSVMPCDEQAIVKGISSDDNAMQYGFAGDHVVLQLTGIDPTNVSTGSMICDIDRPVKVTSRFQARLVIFGIAVPITKGFPVILHYQSLCEQATVKKLVAILNRSTGEIAKSKPRCLTKNSSALVEIEIQRPICLELYKEFRELGRFMLRSGGATIAAGLVTDIK